MLSAGDGYNGRECVKDHACSQKGGIGLLAVMAVIMSNPSTQETGECVGGRAVVESLGEFTDVSLVL